MEAQESTYLALCRSQIEAALEWGPSEEWCSQDFEELSDRISEKTGRTLGSTTLKRVWGRVKYDSSPSQHTLDTLAAFVGEPSWRKWKRTYGKLPSTRLKRVATSEKLTEVARTYWGLFVFAVVAFVIVFALFQKGNPVLAESAVANVQFSSRKVSTGLPNSVVFDYRLNGIEADSFFIQQSWDARLRDKISPENRQFTSIYYYPGHFWAKLIANDTILQEHALIVPTDGWMGLIDTETSVPIYAEMNSFTSDYLSVSDEWTNKSDIDLLKGEHTLNYFNVGSFDPVASESLILEMDLKVEVDEGHAACREGTVILIGEHGRVAIPFALPGCSAKMYLVASDKEVNGRTNDLSPLGIDLSAWHAITVAMQDRLVFVEIDGEKAYQIPYTTDLGKIVGLRFRFKGLGMVKNVTLRDSTGSTFLSDFVK